MSENLQKEEVLGVGITSEKEEVILQYITTSLQNSSKKYYVVTPNPEIITFAQHHASFKTILNDASLALPDGIGVVWAARLLKKSIKRRITGIDVMEKLCQALAKRPIVVGFLGGRPSVAITTAECLAKKYPGLKIGYAQSEWDEKNMTSKSIDILFVAYGFPKQEEWVAKNLPHIPVKVAMSVGGAFDYISGRVPRAPKVMQDTGLEWFYRLIRQPWRAKRQLALLEFIYRVFKAKLRQSK